MFNIFTFESAVVMGNDGECEFDNSKIESQAEKFRTDLFESGKDISNIIIDFLYPYTVASMLLYLKGKYVDEMCWDIFLDGAMEEIHRRLCEKMGETE